MKISEDRACIKCGVPQSVDNFRLHRDGKSRATNVCDECHSAMRRLRYAQDVSYREYMKSKASQYGKTRYKQDAEYREHMIANARSYAETHPEQLAKYRNLRAERISTTYEEFTRYEIYKRDNGTCQYCGTKQNKTGWHLDHVIPLARGGVHTRENVVVSCASCNQSKGARLLSEWTDNPRLKQSEVA